MSPEEFKAWRHRMSWTQQEAADALDVSKATVANYEAGRRRDTSQPVEIPYAIAVTCDALAARSEPDPKFVLRMATTTTVDGLPTEGEAERFRALETQTFLDRVYAGLLRSQRGTVER